MFFEPLPAGEETAGVGVLEVPPWSAPPALEAGAVLAVDQTVARSANVAVRLPVIRAFSQGCILDVQVVSRQAGLSEDDFWQLNYSQFGGFVRMRGGAELPSRLLRLGVRYADGRKATTIESRASHRRQRCDQPPAGPLLSLNPASSGTRLGGEVHVSNYGLWLWPLPPAEVFEFAVEWPLGGIDLTIAELDGAAIVAAASRSAYYWPESEPPNSDA